MPRRKLDPKAVQLDAGVSDWLHQFSIDDSDKQFKIGQIAAEHVDRYGKDFGKSLIRKRIAIEAGVKTSTVRDREEMHRFFPAEVREEFGVLTYHQLRACKAAGKDGWRAIATWAVESADDFGGRPAPVETIRAKVLTDKGHPRPTWREWTIGVRKLAQKIVDDPDAPSEVAEAMSVVLMGTEKFAKTEGTL